MGTTGTPSPSTLAEPSKCGPGLDAGAGLPLAPTHGASEAPFGISALAPPPLD